MSQAVQDICTSLHNDNEICATEFANDRFSCHNNRTLVYVARVIGTAQTNATTLLEYLSMLGPIEISVHNQNLSIISSPNCPLSIPSAEESNCIIKSVTNENITEIATTMSSSKQSNDIVMVMVVALSCFIGIILMAFCIVGAMYICSRCNNYHGDIERLACVNTLEYYL